MKKNLYTMLFSALLLLLIGCNGYEDGPAISLRSKHERMRFSRPIAQYTVQGVDSLAGLMDVIRAECPYFRDNFTFAYDPEEDIQFIIWSDSSMLRGGWSDLGDLKSITISIAQHQPFPIGPWNVKRLSNRALWLESIKGSTTRELRF